MRIPFQGYRWDQLPWAWVTPSHSNNVTAAGQLNLGRLPIRNQWLPGSPREAANGPQVFRGLIRYVNSTAVGIGPWLPAACQWASESFSRLSIPQSASVPSDFDRWFAGRKIIRRTQRCLLGWWSLSPRLHGCLSNRPCECQPI